MSDPAPLLGIIASLVAIISTIVAASLAMAQKAQGKVVEILQSQIAAGEKREEALLVDNKEQAQTISRMGASVDKLTEQGAQTIRLLEDIVYGRQSAQERRRGS